MTGRRFSTEEEDMIKDAVGSGVPVIEVAATVGASKSTIYSICRPLRLHERRSEPSRTRKKKGNRGGRKR